MSDTINTGQHVRPRPGIRLLHLLGVLAVIALIAGAVAVFVNDALMVPTLVGLCALLIGGLHLRQKRHQKKVAAAIYADHGIQVPDSALNDLIHDRDAIVTVDGHRYRVETSDSLPDNTTTPAVVLITPMGADAATVFNH